MCGKKVAIMMFIIIGCWSMLALQGTVSAAEKILRMRVEQDAQSFDPARFTNHTTSVVLRAIYDNLVDYKVGSWPQLENELAEKYTVSSDGLVYTFNLKKGVKWQKGFGELTAEDVKFSVERVMDPATKAPMRSILTDVIQKIETPNNYTIRFLLKKPDPAFLAKLAPWRTGAIVCKKAVEKYGGDYGQKVEAIIGCGPFEVIAWTPKQRITLKRFDQYHGSKPKVDRIEMLIIEDEAIGLLSLQKGELDMCYIRVPESLTNVRNDPNLVVYKGPSATTKGFVAFNTEHPILKDIRVRRAMVHGLDRDLIAETVGGEMGVKACGFLEPASYWGALGCDQLPKYPFDREKAKQLLTEAGYPKGFKIKYVEINLPSHQELAPVLQSYWKDLGIETEIELVPVNDWVDRLNKASSPVTKFTMGTRPPEPSIFLYSSFHSSSSKPGLNAMLYKGVDGLLDKAMSTTSDAERKDLYGQIQQKVIEDCVIIPIFFEANVMVTRKNVSLGRGAKGQLLTCPYWHFYWLEDVDLRP